ncbi:MAG: NAD(P)/FAD-dependent oxidoreductase [Granulosicoccus sp.]
MVEHVSRTPVIIDVVIIGGGPAGLSAATELKRLGIDQVVVLERENQAGGIPRHCGHPPFGMREFTRVMTGPRYARKLVKAAELAGVDIRISTTVVEARPGGSLLIATDQGAQEITARRVVYATGVRETPRSARLISGTRPPGVLSTGSLQSMVYLNKHKPFDRPVIIGSELVSFSSIQTCRHAGISPVAMVEETGSAIARWPTPLYARVTGVPLFTDTRLSAIKGHDNIVAVVVENAQGERREIACDGVILTGRFTPESSLSSCGHLLVDVATGGPVVDQFGRCSDPVYFAAGNVLRPVETAGWSWNEGRQAAHRVSQDLLGKLPSSATERRITLANSLIKYCMPQVLSFPHHRLSMKYLQLRFTRHATGILSMSDDTGTLWKRAMTVFPERRVLVPLRRVVDGCQTGSIQAKFEERSP